MQKGKQMNTSTCLTRARVLAMDSGDEINDLIAQYIFDRKGVGYYGPTKSPTMHLDYALMPSKEAARAAYIEHWKGGPGKCSGEDATIDLCYWQDGHGPVFVGEYSESMDCAFTVEAEIEQRGLQAKYISALITVASDDIEKLAPGLYSGTGMEIFALVHASALDRSKAALISFLSL